MDWQDTLHSMVFIFLQVAWRTAVLAAGVLVVQRLPRRWLGSSLLHLLWLVVAVRLLFPLLSGLWLLGAAYFLARTCYASWRLCCCVRPLKETQDARLLRLLNTCRREMNICRNVVLLVSDATAQPALMGVWRARILLPTSIAKLFSDEELRMVFLHELAHFRRGDIVINWLLAGVRALQWCNPVFWLTSWQIAKHREAACDADVLCIVGRDRFKQYGDTVLRVVQHAMNAEPFSAAAPTCVAGMVCFLGRKNVLRERISMLHRHSCHSSRVRRSLGYVLVAAAVLVGLTDAAIEAQQPQAPPAAWDSNSHNAIAPQQYWVQKSASRKTNEPLYVVAYDVKELLEGDMAKYGMSREIAGISLLQIVAYCVANAEDHDAATNKPSAAFHGDKLIISETKKEHNRIAQQLSVLKEFGDKQVTVEIRYLTVSDAFFDQLGPAFLKEAKSPSAQVNRSLDTVFIQPDTSKPPFQAVTTTTVYSPASAITLSEKDVFHLMQVAQGDARSNILFAPKVTLFNGQTAEFKDCTQRPFVVDVVPITDTIATAYQPAYQPVVQILEEGTTVRLLTVAKHDDVVRLDCKLTHSEITEVQTVRLARLDAPREQTVQRPSLNTTSVQFVTNLKPGRSLVISGISMKPLLRQPSGKFFWSKKKLKPEPRSIVIVITPRVLESP